MAVPSDVLQKDLLQTALLQSLETQGLNEAQLENARKEIEGIAEAMAIYRRDLAAIRSNNHLSRDGVRAQEGALREQTADKLDRATQQTLKTLDRRIAEEQTNLTPQPPAADPILNQLQQQEIRNELYRRYELPGDELRLIADYQAWAVEAGHDDLMRAVEGAPFPMISDPAILEAGRQARASRQSPERAVMLRQLKARRSGLEAALNTALSELGLPTDSLVPQLMSEEV